MNNHEARQILAERLARYRQRSYAYLAGLVAAKEIDTIEVTGPSGASYQLEFLFFWDDLPGGNIRVSGAIDDGGWRAFAPITADFLLSPQGQFVGEQ